MAFDKRKALQNALTYTQQGKWDKAIAEYQAILKADPRDLTVCNNLGDLFARVGKVAEAIDQYLKLGELYRADGLSVKAIAVYKKIIKLDPKQTAAYLACADLYQDQGLAGEAKVQLTTVVEHYTAAGDMTKVIEVTQRLAQLDPSNHALLTKLAGLLLKEGRREAAAAEYERAAEAAKAAGQTAESERLFQKARELVPESAEVNLGFGELRLREGKYAEAVEALTKATAADASNARAWLLLGEAYLRLGQGRDAVTALQQAVALGIPETDARRPLAAALMQSGRTDEAMALCRAFTDDALGQGEFDQAVTFCQELLAVAPNLPALHAHLVALLQGLGRDEEARSASHALAAAHETAGETEAAVQVYRDLLERDPSDAEARSRLETLEVAPPTPVPAEEPLVPSVQEEPAFVLEIAEEAPAAPGWAAGEALQVPPQAEPVYELQEVSELADLQPPSEEPVGATLDLGAGLEAGSMELAGGEIAAVEVAGAEAASRIAETLAEAKTYLNYGLADKARERLQALARLAPDHPELQQLLAKVGEEEMAIPVTEPGLAETGEAAGVEVPSYEPPEAVEIPEEIGVEGPPASGWGVGLPEEAAATPAAVEPFGVAPATGEEELPVEFHALLEEAPAEPVALVPEAGADLDQAMADDLAEAEFYLSQGMAEEARVVQQRMQARSPEHPTVSRLTAQLTQAPHVGGPPPPAAPSPPPAAEPVSVSGVREPAAAPLEPLEAHFEAVAAELAAAPLPQEPVVPPPTEQGPPPAAEPSPPLPAGPILQEVVPKFTVMDSRDAGNAGTFINLGAELAEELAAEERPPAPGAGTPRPQDLLKEFQKGVREHFDEQDFETHYNLGIAYREMELFDEAIQEFQLAGRDPGRVLTCANLLGLCYLAKGQPGQAIRELRAGLETGGHPPEAYRSLRYDLGTAYESQGDLRGALETFEVLQAEDAGFRDVRARVNGLRERLRVPSPPSAPGPKEETPKRTKDKKISFI